MTDLNFAFPAVVAVVAVVVVLGWLLGWALCRWSVRLRAALARNPPGAPARIATPVRAGLAARCPRVWAVLARRLSPRRFVGLPLLLMVFAALVVVTLMAGVVATVLTGEIAPFDQVVSDWVAQYRSAALVVMFRWITQLGGTAALAAVSLVATGCFWSYRRQHFVLPLWVAIGGSQAMTWLGKYLFMRPRPEFVTAVEVHSPSFPSAHAAGAMAVYGFIAYALTRDLHRALPRFHVGYWSGVLIVLVGFSRIFLGVHYVSDVLLGFLLGLFWLLVAFAIHEYRRDRAQWQRSGAGS